LWQKSCSNKNVLYQPFFQVALPIIVTMIVTVWIASTIPTPKWALISTNNRRLDDIVARLARIEDRLTAIENRATALERKVDALELLRFSR
jgi:Fe2+ transport system protein B